MAKAGDIEATVNAYHRLFRTPDGEIVLQDLKRKYYDGRMDAIDLNRCIGQRDVVREILVRVK